MRIPGSIPSNFGAGFFSVFVFALVLSVGSPTFASSTPIIAEAVYVEGKVMVISAADSRESEVSIGMVFSEGDRIRTAADGIIEIEFDTGDLMRVDRDTDMVIKSLSRDEKGATSSVFGLMVGRVKASVTKLTTPDSKFEYHTKAAICGVAGTPPFVVEHKKERTSIDLLGRAGEKGQVYVRGFDPAATVVNLTAGRRTAVTPGAPPLKPFPISPARLRNLNRTIPFKTTPKKERPPAEKPKPAPKAPEEEKKEEPEAPPEEKPGKEPEKAQEKAGAPAPPEPSSPPPPPPQDAAESMAINNMTRSVSIPKQIAPDKVGTDEGVEGQNTGEQGIVEQKTKSGGEAAPPVSKTTFDIIIDLR
ncbi:MAG: FecR family protein [Candidatus Nitrospinota bacterium M3_3B_026]